MVKKRFTRSQQQRMVGAALAGNRSADEGRNRAGQEAPGGGHIPPFLLFLFRSRCSRILLLLFRSRCSRMREKARAPARIRPIGKKGTAFLRCHYMQNRSGGFSVTP